MCSIQALPGVLMLWFFGMVIGSSFTIAYFNYTPNRKHRKSQ